MELQSVAEVLETLYRILVQMACPSSCACDPPPPFIKIDKQDHAQNMEEQL